MNKILSSLVIAAGLVGLAANDAHATEYLLASKVASVTVTENTSDQGASANPAHQLEITLVTSGTHCGTSKTHVIIPRTTSPTLFDAWVRTAEAALLSGRSLRIGSSSDTGACYTWYLTLGT